MKKIIPGLIAIMSIIIAGYFVPLGSYTTQGGCPVEPIPRYHLHLITGDRLSNIKLVDGHGVGALAEDCSINTKYTEYLL
jgi:hypothetical protein